MENEAVSPKIAHRGEEIAFNSLEVCNYRHLQIMAKQMGLPSNVKKVDLIEMIRAKKYCTEMEVQAIVDRVMAERKAKAAIRKKQRKKIIRHQITRETATKSPPITITPVRPSKFVIEYNSENPPEIIKYAPRPSVVEAGAPFLQKIKSDRVLRSYSSCTRPNYRLLDQTDYVVGLEVVKSRKTINGVRHQKRIEHYQQIRQERTFHGVNLPSQKQGAVLNVFMMNADRQLVPVISRSLVNHHKTQTERQMIDYQSNINRQCEHINTDVVKVSNQGTTAQHRKVYKNRQSARDARISWNLETDQAAEVKRAKSKKDINTQTGDGSIRQCFGYTTEEYRSQVSTSMNDKAPMSTEPRFDGEMRDGNMDHARSKESPRDADNARNINRSRDLDYTRNSERISDMKEYSGSVDYAINNNVQSYTGLSRMDHTNALNSNLDHSENVDAIIEHAKNVEVATNTDLIAIEIPCTETELRKKYPNMFGLTNIPDKNYTQLIDIKCHYSFCYHREIRTEQVRVTTVERLPRINEAFSRFNDTGFYKNLSQPLYVKVSQELERVPIPMTTNDCLERIYNLKNNFIKNQPHYRASLAETTYIFSTKTVPTAYEQSTAAVNNCNSIPALGSALSRSQAQSEVIDVECYEASERASADQLHNADARPPCSAYRQPEPQLDVAGGEGVELVLSQSQTQSEVIDVECCDASERASADQLQNADARPPYGAYRQLEPQLHLAGCEASECARPDPLYDAWYQSRGYSYAQPEPQLDTGGEAREHARSDLPYVGDYQPSGYAYTQPETRMNVDGGDARERAIAGQLYDGRYAYAQPEAQLDAEVEEIMSPGATIGTQESQNLSENVDTSYPEMYDDALDVISQDGDFMERIGMEGIGMEVRMQCILCSQWAGPKFLLDYHLKKDHSQEIQQLSTSSPVQLTVTRSLGKRAWNSKLFIHQDTLYALSSQLTESYLLLALSVIPNDLKIPQRCKMTVLNKRKQPTSYEGDLKLIPSSMPYEYGLECIALDVASLDFMPNNNPRLMSWDFDGNQSRDIERPQIDGAQIFVRIEIFE